MVSFDKGKGHFNYRVAGVVVHNDRVLLDRNTRNKYWVLPGGHPDMMESMAAALKREMYEEIGADVEVIRLLWIMENFYYREKPIHELSFYFLMHLDPSSVLLRSDGPFYGEEGNSQLIFQWHPINETSLCNLPLYPSYLASALLNMPSTPLHIVFDDSAQSHSQRTAQDAPNRENSAVPVRVKPIPTGEGDLGIYNKG